MKTYNNLFDQICDPANIEKAILKASLGKRLKKSVQRALRKRKEIAAYLSEQLKTGQWRPIELHSAKVINDGVELKKRLIICPAFVKRLYDVIEGTAIDWKPYVALFRRRNPKAADVLDKFRIADKDKDELSD